MYLLVAVCAPWIPDVDAAEFLGVGAAYCLLLAGFAVGLLLAGRRVFRAWAAAGAIPAAGMVALLVWLALRPDPADPRGSLYQLQWALRSLQGVIAAYLVVGLAIAGSGWIGYIRRCRPIAAEPLVAPDPRRQ